MKHILVVLAFVLPVQVFAKTCKAFLHGTLKHEELTYEKTKVFYPDGVIRDAEWQGKVVTKKFISPYPLELTCGTPWFMGYFENVEATGMLPPMIKTMAWKRYDSSGNLEEVPPTVIWGFGSGGDYPYPSFTFKNTETLFIHQPTPAGQDICDMTKLELPEPLTFRGKIENDPADLTKFSEPYDGTKSYRWDPTSSPTNDVVELELKDPHVIITCDALWEYELTMTWPYIVPADHDSLCGPAELHREMKIEGFFSLSEDDKVSGYMKVLTPSVTFSGGLSAYYTGAPFSLPIVGRISGEAPSQTVSLPLLEGGDGFGWHFTAMCPWGTQTYHVDNIGSYYINIINEQESIDVDPEIGTVFKLNADGDEDTFVVDKGGEQIVTIKRSWKKISP